MGATTTEDVLVFKVDTGASIKNIGELRKYIDQLKASIKDEDKTIQQNAKDVEALREAQAALKDAMYATTKSTEELTEETDKLWDENGKLTVSYNDLVHQLAELKSAWRATNDEAQRADLAEAINRVNDQLKEMDASTGNFSRNVGNYTNSFKKALSEFPSFAAPAKKALDDINKTVGLMGKQPLIGILVMLAPLIQKITQALKENETAQEAIRKILDQLKPVADWLQQVIEKIAGWISVATDRIIEWAGEHMDAFKKVVSGAAGVGNAILQFLLTPIKTVINAAKGLGAVFKDIFTGNWKQIKQDANTAIKGIGEAFRNGFDFKANFSIGKAAGDAFIEGLGGTRKRAKETAAGIAADVVEEFEEAEKMILYSWEELERMYEQGVAERAKRRQLANELALKENEIFNNELVNQENELSDEINSIQDGLLADMIERNNKEQQMHKDRVTLAYAYADTLRSVLGSIADIMEEEADGNARTARRVKGLRIAAATIDTISGAIAAYVSGVNAMMYSPVPGAGIALGIAQAATVLAAGAAQIAKIRAVQTDGNGSASVPTAMTATAVATPSVPQSVQQTTAIETAYNTKQINEAQGDQRVYILQSDLEASGRQVSVRETESTF